MKDKCIELLDGRAAAANLTNIRGVVGMAADAALPDSDPSFDVYGTFYIILEHPAHASLSSVPS